MAVACSPQVNHGDPMPSALMVRYYPNVGTRGTFRTKLDTTRYAALDSNGSALVLGDPGNAVFGSFINLKPTFAGVHLTLVAPHMICP